MSDALAKAKDVAVSRSRKFMMLDVSGLPHRPLSLEDAGGQTCAAICRSVQCCAGGSSGVSSSRVLVDAARRYIPPVDNRASLSFLRLLANLRWLTVAGQALTVLIVSGPMEIDLPETPLWAGIGALALFNAYATWRARVHREASAMLIFLHILVDVLSLSWMVGWSGGIENPFSSLFLLPIALSIHVLPHRWVWVTAAASLVGYSFSALFARELPHVHGIFGDAFSLHKAGMLANFVVSGVVVLVFFTRMAAAWRQSEREVARLREQFARNEGIIALATHAASVAHELNTPLGTLMLMVEDLRNEAQSAAQREEFATMKALLEVCRDRVRELASPADTGVSSIYASGVDIERVIERWQLVRPTIELHRTGSMQGLERVDPAVGHLLQALLNNAADAGEKAGTGRVDLLVETDQRALRASIRDYGAGFDQTQAMLPGTLFRSNKPDGLGIGLALSHATVERLGGELSMHSATDGPGVVVSFHLPMAVKT
jgi:two-component system, sensor histidine kinase RegB